MAIVDIYLQAMRTVTESEMFVTTVLPSLTTSKLMGTRTASETSVTVTLTALVTRGRAVADTSFGVTGGYILD